MTKQTLSEYREMNAKHEQAIIAALALGDAELNQAVATQVREQAEFKAKHNLSNDDWSALLFGANR